MDLGIQYILHKELFLEAFVKMTQILYFDASHESVHVNSRGFLVLCTIWLPIDDYCKLNKVSSHFWGHFLRMGCFMGPLFTHWCMDECVWQWRDWYDIRERVSGTWTPGDFWYCVLFGSLLTITVSLQSVKSLLGSFFKNRGFMGPLFTHWCMDECAWQWRDWYDIRERESGTWTPGDFWYCVLFGSLLAITVSLTKCQVTFGVIF